MSEFLNQIFKETLSGIQSSPSLTFGKIVKIKDDLVDIQISIGNPDSPSHFKPGEIIKDVSINLGKGMVDIDPQLNDSVICGFAYMDEDSPYILRYGNDKSFLIEESNKEESIPSTEQQYSYHKFDQKVKVPYGNYSGNWGYGVQGGDAKGSKLVKNESDISPIILNNYKGKLAWPAPGINTITSVFGKRVSPTAGASTYHGGIDIGAFTGSTIVAAYNGKIVQAGTMNGYGQCITIEHPNNFFTRYAHLSKISVSINQQVSGEEKIGEAGSTGVSSGPHLHFETMEGQDVKKLDPAIFLNRNE